MGDEMPKTDGDTRSGSRGERGSPAVHRRTGQRLLWLLGLGLVGVAAVGGCSSAGGPDVSTRTPDDQAVPSASPSGGRTSTQLFRPSVALNVPGGWTTDEDSTGNFLVIPSWGSLGGVDPGTSDYIGVYTRVAAGSCADVPSRHVPATVVGIGSWLTGQPTIVSTRPRQASVGGLRGTVQDLNRAPGAGTLPCRHGRNFSPLIVGLPPSELVHALIPGLVLRLYLLDYRGGVLAIEVDDILTDHGRDMAALVQVVRSMRFTSK